MFCANCGKKLADHLKFCTECGTPVAAPAEVSADPTPAPKPVQAPVYQPVPAPANKPAPAPKSKKKNSQRMILLIVIAAVVLIGIVVLGFVTGIFSSDKTKVTNAIAKSALQYTEASAQIALPKLAEEGEKIAISQSMNVQIDELPMMPELEGFGVQVAMDTDLPGRALGMTVTPSYGSAEILDVQILLNDAELFFTVPQLVGDRAYVINTETIGSSLIDMDLADEELRSFGFNIFDMNEIIQEAAKVDEDAQQELNDAVKALVKAIAVEKTGKETIEVNDNDLKCTAYQVVIPEDALQDLLNAIEDFSRNVDTVDLYVDLFESMGFPNYMIDELAAEMGDVDASDQVFDSINTIIDDLGDIELEVFLHKGYVASVFFEDSIMGADFELTVNLGGGKNYVDDLRMELLIDDVEIVLESTGDHTSPKGVFTDTTTVDISTPYSDTVTFSSELYYEPDADSDNYSWSIDAEMLKVELAGQITADETSVSVQLDEVGVWAEGEYLIGLGMDVSMGEYQGITLNTNNAVDVMSLTEDALYEEIALIEETATQWAASLMESNPELVELLNSMMY